MADALLQPLLLMAALVAVPWMLFPKPYILRKRHMERHQRDVRGPVDRASFSDVFLRTCMLLLTCHSNVARSLSASVVTHDRSGVR